MKLNIGCGSRRLPGYVGVDAVAREAADIVANADALPMGDGCADEVMAIHLVEHFYEWELPAVFSEWARVLRPGGLLVLELPDLRRCARNIVEGAVERKPGQLTLWGIFGDPTTKDPFMMHKSGWWFSRLEPVVRAAGFGAIVEKDTMFHPAGRRIRDFRLEARKGAA